MRLTLRLVVLARVRVTPRVCCAPAVLVQVRERRGRYVRGARAAQLHGAEAWLGSFVVWSPLAEPLHPGLTPRRPGARRFACSHAQCVADAALLRPRCVGPRQRSSRRRTYRKGLHLKVGQQRRRHGCDTSAVTRSGARCLFTRRPRRPLHSTPPTHLNLRRPLTGSTLRDGHCRCEQDWLLSPIPN